ncbi:MAG: TonB-dependent receptor [Gemmatimonadetes bacterium]|nr:TonB-dependent receptor [Gemmatimonadota bacterium]
MAAAPAVSWSGPLGRLVSFHSGDLSLREALDRLAAAARVRLSYSSESLDLDRVVCVSLDSAAVGLVLSRLLQGSRVEPVAAGPDHIVLAPMRTAIVQTAERAPVVLERIVVTGSAAGAARKPLPVAIDILEGQELADRSASTVTQAFNASVPGVWLWEQSPSRLLAQYGSIRGASSFGLSYPKVYIDGIQVANPLLITRLTPEAIDHIEVIRGPQGAALYGADAISGVANIVMRQEGADAGAPRGRLRTGVGLANSDYSANPSLAQDHVLTLRGGSNTRSLGLNFEAGSTGAYIPGAYQRHFGASAAARSVGAHSLLTGTLRFFAERAGSPVSPLLPASIMGFQPRVTGTRTTPQSLVEYTAGTTLKFTEGDRLTNSLVVGIDGYSLDGVHDDRGPVPSAADAALLAARGGGDRATIRLSSVAHIAQSNESSADVTFVGEQSFLYQWTDADPLSVMPSHMTTTYSTGRVGQWRNNGGMSVQMNTALADRFFLTAGVRVERFSGSRRVASLPMLGGAWVLQSGPFSLKLRGAYGKGIRWPETTVRETLWVRTRDQIDGGNLAPEEQSGVEGGLDLIVGRTLSLQITRFDQVASGLIQRVMTSADTASASGPGGRHLEYQIQNVGEITNRGWEFQGALRRGAFRLTGTLSLADSRVRRVATGYTGDLAVGDRMLDVPARTISLTGFWSGSGWSASVTGYRAEDWISYDRLALVQSLAMTNRPWRDFVGPMLRSYWMQYPGVTHLRASLGRSLRHGLTLTISGDNLLNRQSGEPDNVTVLPGRTISVGMRAEF